MCMKNKPNRRVDEEYVSALAQSEKWKILNWLVDNLDKCPNVDWVGDIAAVEGRLGFTSAEGELYTLTLKKENWEEIR